MFVLFWRLVVIFIHLKGRLESGTSLLVPIIFRGDLVLTPLLFTTCTLHLKRTLNTDHILGSETAFVAERIIIQHIVFTNSSVVLTLTRFDLN